MEFLEGFGLREMVIGTAVLLGVYSGIVIIRLARLTRTRAPEPARDKPDEAVKPDHSAPTAHGYRLQMGVFTSAANAQELHAGLEQAGIPSYVESRVHVGPFRTQQEADAARRRLQALGLGPGLLIPPQKR